MSRFIRLYPMAWRRRYEAELVELLDQRPLTAGQTFDMVRGAIDAHLHPDLIGGLRQPWTHRLPGLLAAAAGLIWSWFWLRVLLAAPNQEWGESIGLAVLLMFIAVPGDYMAAYARRIGVAIAAIVVAMYLGLALPWSVADGLLNQVAGATAWLLAWAGMLTLVAARAGIGPAARWFLLAIAVLVPATIAIPILGGFGPSDRGGAQAMLVALLPYGIAWTLIGVRMTLRGSATMTDPPGQAITAEIPAT